jgi:hypothetical protein
MRLRDRWGAGSAARTEALRRAWDSELQRFACYYSGAPLDEEDFKSAWYLSFDHRTPGDEADLVVCAQLVNHFKSNLTEEELRRLVIQLAERFTRKRDRIETFRPTFWGRSVKPFR